MTCRFVDWSAAQDKTYAESTEKGSRDYIGAAHYEATHSHCHHGHSQSIPHICAPFVRVKTLTPSVSPELVSGTFVHGCGTACQRVTSSLVVQIEHESEHKPRVTSHVHPSNLASTHDPTISTIFMDMPTALNPNPQRPVAHHQ